MKNQKSVSGRWSAQAPGHRMPHVQHETNVTRAYGSVKVKPFGILSACSSRRSSPLSPSGRTVSRMHDLIMLEPAEILGPENAQKFQECQGQADACNLLADLIDTQKLRGDDLGSCLAQRLFAAWPPDYLEYRKSYMAFLKQDPTMPDKVDCLELHDWHASSTPWRTLSTTTVAPVSRRAKTRRSSNSSSSASPANRPPTPSKPQKKRG